MSTPVLTFFNIKRGVGKTSLVYHLAWIFSQVGKRVVAIDLDPQANLTSAFLDESQLEKLWDLEKPQGGAGTIFQCASTKRGRRHPAAFNHTDQLTSCSHTGRPGTGRL